jgi:prepilin-type N-terminal cleavage/methylation domain-containing protein
MLKSLFKNKIARKMNKGFTLIELIVSLAIFAFMTAFLVARYGTFNQGVLLTNLAYDVAITIRSAQTYGLNVQGSAAGGAGTVFVYPYGVHFDKGSNRFILYTDLKNNCAGTLMCGYDSTYVPDEIVNTYKMKPGNTVKEVCVGTGPGAGCTNLAAGGSFDVVFKRPNPDAVLISGGNASTYAEITLSSSDNSLKKVILRSTGQVAVQN